MKVYIAGPIAGYQNGNRHAFSAAVEFLETQDLSKDLLVAVNPFDVKPHVHEGQCPVGCFIRTDLIAMLGCDAVYFLKGWERSAGAFVEFTVARATGLELWFQ